jgi:GT2 family glycosyltransferase
MLLERRRLVGHPPGRDADGLKGPAQRTAGGAVGTGRDVTAVVCTYAWERRALLEQAIASLEGQTAEPSRIVIVIDGDVRLLEWARGRWPRHSVVPNAHRQGLSGARNTGLHEADGAIVAFLDDDARARADWLARLLNVFEDPRVDAAGGTVAPAWAAGRPGWFPSEFNWVVGCTYRGMPTTCAPVRNPVGAGMAFRKAAIDEVGGFRSELGRVGGGGAGCEETELCLRIGRRAGCGVVLFDPDARVDHAVPRKRGRFRYFVSRCWSEGRSKAEMVRLSEGARTLETERRYATRVLPMGVARGVLDLVRGSPAGAGRAGAILLGALATAAGYAVGRTVSAIAGRHG